MADTFEEQDEPAADEIERRRDKIAKRMLNTPPKPRVPKPKPKPETEKGE